MEEALKLSFELFEKRGGGDAKLSISTIYNFENKHILCFSVSVLCQSVISIQSIGHSILELDHNFQH